MIFWIFCILEYRLLNEKNSAYKQFSETMFCGLKNQQQQKCSIRYPRLIEILKIKNSFYFTFKLKQMEENNLRTFCHVQRWANVEWKF